LKGANRGAAGAGLPCMFSFHAAFKEPATPPDAPNRWRNEVRCGALID